MEEKVFRSLTKKVKKIEKEHGSLENFVVNTTIWDEGHKLKLEDDFSSIVQQMQQVYQDISALELADLVDYQNFVGRFDGKFS
jgi:hypothetical protein